MTIFFELENSQDITSQKNMKQSLITDHFEKLLCIKSVRTVSYSEYKSIEMQDYLRKIISDTFANIFGPWLGRATLTKIILANPFINSEGGCTAFES